MNPAALRRTFTGADALALSAAVLGSGQPLLCHPGGPGNSAGYFEDLAGLAAGAQLVLLDPRGCGRSVPRPDPAAYTVAGQAADIDAVREQLGVERLAVLAHSAGGRPVLEWAAAHPDRVRALVLVATPLAWDDATQADRTEVGRQRAGEPWYPAAAEAAAGLAYAPPAERARLERLTRPFWYARWDARSQAHEAALDRTVNLRAAFRLRADARHRPRPELAAVRAPAVVIAGGLDTAVPPPAARRLAEALPAARFELLAGASHFPWIDDPPAFRDAVGGFLAKLGP